MGTAGGAGNVRKLATAAEAVAHGVLNWSPGHDAEFPADSSVSSRSSMAGEVRILEFFHDKASLFKFMQDMETARNASIMSTSPKLVGKRIHKYRFQRVLPEQAVIVSCHPWNPIEKMSSAVAASAGVVWGFCHSPPTTSQMVYTEVEYDDAAVERVIWACHVEGLEKRMCHAINWVVVDQTVLRSMVSGR